MGRLTKDEKQKLINLIALSKDKKVLSMRDMYEVDDAWSELVWDHKTRLRLDLQHISDRPLLDALQAECIDSDFFLTTGDYFHHYTDEDLKDVLRYILDAEKAFESLKGKVSEELKKRFPPGTKTINLY